MKGAQFYVRNPFKRNFWNSQFAQKNEGMVDFTKEIPLNEISEKFQNLLKKVKGVNFTKEIPLKVKAKFCSKITYGESDTFVYKI